MPLLYLSRADIAAAALPMPRMIAALDSMFKQKGASKVEMPPKPGIHPKPDAFIHAMPALIPIISAAGMKWVSGFPENQKPTLPISQTPTPPGAHAHRSRTSST